MTSSRLVVWLAPSQIMPQWANTAHASTRISIPLAQHARSTNRHVHTFSFTARAILRFIHRLLTGLMTKPTVSRGRVSSHATPLRSRSGISWTTFTERRTFWNLDASCIFFDTLQRSCAYCTITTLIPPSLYASYQTAPLLAPYPSYLLRSRVP